MRPGLPPRPSWLARGREHECRQDRQSKSDVDKREDPRLGLEEDQPMRPVADEVAGVARLPGQPPELVLPVSQWASDSKERLDDHDPDRGKMDHPEPETADPAPVEHRTQQDRDEAEHDEADISRVEHHDQICEDSGPGHESSSTRRASATWSGSRL